MDITKIEEHFRPVGSGWRSKAEDTGKLHLSDIAKYISHKLKLDNYSASNWDLILAAEAGFLWEDELSRAYANRYAARIGEVELDGVIGSPDGLSDKDPYEVEPLVNEEYKLTWRSVNKRPEDNFYWMTQFKSYCRMLGVTVTVLRVLYVNGDYKGSGPIYRVYRIEFTEEELQENWDMIIKHRDEMLRLGFLNFNQVKGEDE